MTQTFELFSDLFALRNNALSRRDPRAKLLACVAATVAAGLSTRVHLPLAVMAVAMGGMLLVRVPVRLIVARLLPPLGIVALLGLLRTFLIGSTPLGQVALGSWTLTATQEGFHEGVLLLARVLGAVSALILLSLTTPAHRVFAALRWLRVPQVWVETAMLMYRYVFLLLDQTADIFAAQRARLGYAGAARSLRSMGTLGGAVLQRAFDQADRAHEAMMARGYRGEIPFGTLGPTPAGDMLLLGAVLALLAVGLALGEGWLA